MMREVYTVKYIKPYAMSTHFKFEPNTCRYEIHMESCLFLLFNNTNRGFKLNVNTVSSSKSSENEVRNTVGLLLEGPVDCIIFL